MQHAWYSLVTALMMFPGQQASETTDGLSPALSHLTQSIFLPPAELRWTNMSSSVVPSLSATALITSLPVAATAIRIVVYV